MTPRRSVHRSSKRKRKQKRANGLLLGLVLGIGISGLIVIAIVVIFLAKTTFEIPSTWAGREKQQSPLANAMENEQLLDIDSSAISNVEESPPSIREPSLTPPRLSVEDLVVKVKPGVLRLTVMDQAGRDLRIGSGFLFDDSGLVATNFHVIRDGHTVIARCFDGSEIEVSGCRAWDDKRDLAILQLDEVPSQLQPVQLVKSQKIRQGAPVVAIGSPRGLDFTSSSGEVSGIKRTDELTADLRAELKAPEDQVWIQTNATISGGSSGGPLFNDFGEVVGINTWTLNDVDFAFAAHVQHLEDLNSKTKPQITPLAALFEAEPGNRGLGSIFQTLDRDVAAIWTEFSESHRQFKKRLDTAKSRELLKTIRNQDPAPKFAVRFLDLANEKNDPKSEFQALFFAAIVLSESELESESSLLLRQTTEAIIEKHAQEELLGLLALKLSATRIPERVSFFRELLKTNPHRDVQGICCLSLAKALQNEKQWEEMSKPEKDKVVELYERVVKEFGSVQLGQGPQSMTLSEIAEPIWFEKKFLNVGQVAPEIEGVGPFGESFRLSDFRGKVVILDFFANWCPYCRDMFPKFREALAGSYRNRPVELIGVSADKRDELQFLLNQKIVTWRTWSDGPGGPIAKLWNVKGYPAIFIIDHRGVIQYRISGRPGPHIGRQLDAAVEKLVRIAEKRRK